MKFITLTNLGYFLTKLKGLFVQQEAGKGLSSNDFTNSLKSNYDNAYTHSEAAHAPSNAQENVIESISRNGTPLTVTSKSVNIIVPTKISDLADEDGLLTSHPNITLDTDTAGGSPIGPGNTATFVNGLIRDENGHITKYTIRTISIPEEYIHPNSGVTAGTYKSVTVNAQGHITAGTNPTTLDDYGITDAYTKEETDQKIATEIANIDHLMREVVESLPEIANANPNTIYMIKRNPDDPNDTVYLMHMLINDVWYILGDTECDLTGYVHESDLIPVTNQEIDALFE